MLIIGREVGQSVIIGDAIKVTVLQFGSKLKLAIDAPKKTQIVQLKKGAVKIGGLKKTERMIGDTVQIENRIKITLIQTETGQLRFAIDAPKEIGIFREEIYQNQM